MSLGDWAGESNRFICNETIKNIQIPGTLIEDVEFSDVIFIGCNFSNVKFFGVTFTRSTFKRCNFAAASFRKCGFWSTFFHDCKLIGINWAIAGLAFDSQFHECRLDHSSFGKLTMRNKKFEKCSAIECDFSHCDLRKSQFIECDLSHCSFTGSDVRDANFLTSTGLFIDPTITKVGNTTIGSDAAARLAVSLGFTIPDFLI